MTVLGDPDLGRELELLAVDVDREMRVDVVDGVARVRDTELLHALLEMAVLGRPGHLPAHGLSRGDLEAVRLRRPLRLRRGAARRCDDHAHDRDDEDEHAGGADRHHPLPTPPHLGRGPLLGLALLARPSLLLDPAGHTGATVAPRPRAPAQT